MDTKDKWVDAGQCAAHFGQAKTSIYRMAAAKLIPSIPAGPRLTGRRFNLAEVENALKALAQKAVKP